MTSSLKAALDEERAELEAALDESIEETMRTDGPMNAVAWLAVVVGAFLLNLALLTLITGG